MTHFLAAYGLGRFLPRSGAVSRPALALFCLGGVLPDLFNRAPKIVWPGNQLVASLVFPFHTPAGLLLLCLALGFAFEEKRRPAFVAWLTAGVGLHLVLDFLQRSIGAGSYYWLFPFSWIRFEGGLFWPDQSLWFLPWLVGLCLLVEVFNWRRRRPG